MARDPIGYSGGVSLYGYIENICPNNADTSGTKPGKGGPYHPPPGVHVGCNPNDSWETIKNKMYLLEKMINSHTGWDRNMPPPRGGGRHLIMTHRVSVLCGLMVCLWFKELVRPSFARWCRPDWRHWRCPLP